MYVKTDFFKKIRRHPWFSINLAKDSGEEL